MCVLQVLEMSPHAIAENGQGPAALSSPALERPDFNTYRTYTIPSIAYQYRVTRVPASIRAHEELKRRVSERSIASIPEEVHQTYYT